MCDRTSTLHSAQCPSLYYHLSPLLSVDAVDRLWNDSSMSRKLIQALHAVIFPMPQNVDTVSHPVNAWNSGKLDITLWGIAVTLLHPFSMACLAWTSNRPSVSSADINWYGHHYARILWAGVQSDKFSICNGVGQGGILSRFLFGIYIDELSRYLQSISTGCL